MAAATLKLSRGYFSVEILKNPYKVGRVRFTPEKPSLFGETLESLKEQVEAAGFKGFRAKQVMEWLYKKRVDQWDAMSNLPKDFRAWLAETFILYPTSPVIDKRSNDVTQKLLLQLEDKALIETVLIRAPQTGVGQEDSRKTVCVSIQVGCAYGCKFCASGLAGFRRNLMAAEVVSQLMHICRREDGHTERAKEEIASFDNIVFMGMGEPLANYDTLVRTIRILNADWGLNFGARRITVSTSGLAPQILKLAEEGVAIRLAISLHGATNEVRNLIMPINKRYPLEELIPAAKAFQQKHGRMLTLEFILIEGINDSLDQARELVKIARELHAHVNCIPYNTVEGLEWKRPSVRQQDAFVDVLRKAGVSATIRREKGHDIDAACGQLRLKTEQDLAIS
ncbi:MAG: 23S rRNA (adenine2503-C2)-methyltransferase [Lentimonas sp.]